MDWLTFTSKVIEALAWPMVALVLGLLFRRKLLDLIPAMRKFKAGPLEAEFELSVKEIRASATVAVSEGKPSSNVELESKPEGGNEIVEKLLDARSDPAGMILDGWSSVDGELFRLAHQMGDIVDPLTSTTKIYEVVKRSQVLPYQTQRMIEKLRELRNSVAHAKVIPTSDAAQDYILAVDRVIQLIHNYRKNLPNYGSTNR